MKIGMGYCFLILWSAFNLFVGDSVLMACNWLCCRCIPVLVTVTKDLRQLAVAVCAVPFTDLLSLHETT